MIFVSGRKTQQQQRKRFIECFTSSCWWFSLKGAIYRLANISLTTAEFYLHKQKRQQQQRGAGSLDRKAQRACFHLCSLPVTLLRKSDATIKQFHWARWHATQLGSNEGAQRRYWHTSSDLVCIKQKMFETMKVLVYTDDFPNSPPDKNVNTIF